MRHKTIARRGRRTRLLPAGRAARQRGLTLVELLVAISVLAFVAVLGWRGLDGIVRARVALNADLEQTRGMQLAFAQLQNDAAHVVPRDVLPDHTPLAIDQDRLRMVRQVFAYNQPGRLQVITYRIANGVLTRRESAATRDLNELNVLWQASANDSDVTNPAVELQSGVQGMTMRVWSTDNKGWRSADSEQVGAAPDPAAAAAAAAAAAGGGPVSKGSIMGAAASPVYNGLEVSLKLQGKDANLVKVLLLGAV
ncbi:MAG: prepilin-type N-terminal cleavage/methylation protein [Herminiimonas sp.]|nr:prepilin-type N-terminal cleavage/methylation protein [Herminiimonas sp.]